jgi:RND superfamily putative drug exporter
MKKGISSMSEKKDFFINLGEKVIAYRVLILTLWIVLTVFGAFGAAKVDSVLRGEGATVKGSESYRQNEIVQKYFPHQYTKNLIITLKSKSLKLEQPEFISAMNKIKSFLNTRKEVGSIFDFNTDGSLASEDHKGTFILIGIRDAANEQNIGSEIPSMLAARIKNINIDPRIELHATGEPLIVNDMAKISDEDGARAERKILPLVVVLLILVFGALVSALIPVIVAFISIIITLGCLFVIGHYFELTIFCKAISSMMGLGVGIDYSLFMVSRFREEIEKGLSPKDAAIQTTATAGKAVCYSGVAVTIGMAALLIPNLALTRSIGFSGVLVVIIAILMSLTLLPVIFSMLGDKINAPKVLGQFIHSSWGKRNIWIKWSNIVMNKPYEFFFFGIILLSVLSYFTLHLKLGTSGVMFMPKELDSRQGFVDVLEIDPSRKFSPMVISFETKDGSSVYEKRNISKIYDFAEKMTETGQIARIIGIVDPTTGTSVESYQNLYANTMMLQNMQVVQPNPLVSADGTKTILWAMHKFVTKEAADLDTIVELRKMRDNYNSENLDIMVGGIGSTNIDFKKAVYEYFPLIIILIVIATYIIMFSLLGSIILPIKAIVMNIFSVTASYGWLILVFQYGFTAGMIGVTDLPGSLLITTPLILFCIIFGLSMDYEIFMMSRIKEEYDKTQNTRQAVSVGLQRSGGIITNAALIMIIVFEAFAFSKIILVQEIGLGLATAVFIDATIIRVMLVPSILKILGKWSWWLPKGWSEKLNFIKIEH